MVYIMGKIEATEVAKQTENISMDGLFMFLLDNVKDPLRVGYALCFLCSSVHPLSCAAL